MKSKGSLFSIGMMIMLLIFMAVGCFDDNGNGNNPNPATEAQITGVVHFPNTSYQQVTTVILDETKSVTTGTGGTFSFEKVALGEHTLRIDSALFGSRIYEVNLTKDGLTVDLDAELVRVHTVVGGDQQVQLQARPQLLNGAAQVRIELSEELTREYQELGVVGPNSQFAQDITPRTQPERIYYLRLTYLDSTGDSLKTVYSRFSYLSPIELTTPADGDTVTEGTFFNWNGLAQGTYQLQIESEDGGYSEHTGMLADSGYLLGAEFDLTPQIRYYWSVKGLVSDQVGDWILSEVYSPIRSFIYTEGAQLAQITGRVNIPDTGTGTVAVVYLDEEKAVVTNSDGSFTFNEVLVGMHTLRVDSAQYGSDLLQVDLTHGGATVELNALCTSVLTLVDPSSVRVLISPEFPEDVAQIQVEWSEDLAQNYQPMTTIPKGDLAVQDVTSITNPDEKYYLKFTYLDQEGNELQKAYNFFYTYSPLTILEPGDEDEVNDQTLFRWTELPQAEYQVRITATDYSYSNVSNFLTFNQMTLGDEFTLINQSYSWEVTAYILDGTDNFINDARAKVRSAAPIFTYVP